MKSKGYTYYQPNSKDLKNLFGDCVIRAFSKTEDRSWVEIYDELVPIAREMQCMPNTKHAYVKWLKAHGYVYTGISNKKGSKRPTVSGFATSHKQGRYVMVAANHLVAAVDGSFYDSWDSGEKCLYGYWQKTN